MAVYDLTTLAGAKTWAGITSGADDALLGQLITQTSRLILNALNRGSLLPLTYNEAYDGNDGIRLFIKNWPVIAINSLTINGLAIPVSPAWAANASPIPGYVLDTLDDPMPPGLIQQVTLRGYTFRKGQQNVILNYSAGYQTTNEPQTVPGSPYQVTSAQPYGAWATDQGVTYASGIALTKVPSLPAVGQYAVASGLYTFAAADTARAILISYGFIPVDLALLCQEWVGELYAYRGRIGETSKSLGGQETVAFDTAAIPARVALGLQPYARTVPI